MAQDDSTGLAAEPFRGDWIKLGGIALGVACLTGLAFLPVLACGFINGDDDWNFRDNLAFRGLEWDQIRWAWTTRLVGVYQPVAWMILEAEYEYFGLAPRGYHATSLLLHAANAVVLFVLTRTLLIRCLGGGNLEPSDRAIVDGASAVATLLFAVHPLRAEVVAWASCQPYLPCVLFGMLAVLAYLKAHEDGRTASESIRWRLGSVALTVAALLCKAPAVAIPAILVVLDYYPLRRVDRKAWLEKLWFVVPAVGAMVLAIAARRSLSLTETEARPLTFRVAQAAYAACFYPTKTLVPVDLIAFYPFPDHPDWTSPGFVLSLIVVAGFTLFAWSARRRWPGLTATWVAYLAALAPCSGLVPMGRAMLADRYSYLSMLVWVPLVAYGLTRLARSRWSRWLDWKPGLTIFGMLAILTGYQCSTWRDPETLWRHALTHGSSGSADVRTALGTVLAEQGRFAEAEVQFAEAVWIEPTSAASRNNLGLVRLDQGHPDRAIPELLEAIKLRPGYDLAYNNLGLALARTGKPNEAVPCFERAVQARPTSAEAHNNLGFTLLELGQKADAVVHFQQALQIRPDYAPARRNLVVALAPIGEEIVLPDASISRSNTRGR